MALRVGVMGHSLLQTPAGLEQGWGMGPRHDCLSCANIQAIDKSAHAAALPIPVRGQPCQGTLPHITPALACPGPLSSPSLIEPTHQRWMVRAIHPFTKALATIPEEQVPGSKGCLHLPCLPAPLGAAFLIFEGGFDHTKLPSPPGS